MIKFHPILGICSKSQEALLTVELDFVTTVNFFPSEKAAVFIPMPNRPRSLSSRTWLGSEEPMRIFSIKSLELMPSPSSEITIRFFSQSNWILISCALAEMQLSIISAIAVSSLYPTERSDSRSSLASGID